MNAIMLDQARRALCQTLENEGLRVILKTYQLKDNGFGEMVPDYSLPPVTKKIMARIAIDSGTPAENEQSTAGLSTNYDRIIITDYRTPMTEGAFITGLEREYKIGPVTPLIKFGGTYGYQAILIEGT